MNPNRLFLASCLALVATSMAFSIRADIIPLLKIDFGFTDTQMGQVAGPGLWGFAITILIGGLLADFIGMGRLMVFAFVGHVVGVVCTIFAEGYWSLYFATLLIGLANGMVEAVINPLTATLYRERKAKYLNVLHAWWPGGLIVGGLLGYGITKIMGLGIAETPLAVLSLGWKIKMALILIPTALYGYLMLGQKFPKTERVTSGVSHREMFRETLKPLFILMTILMMFTAATELGPDQWVGNLLQNLVGIQGILLLVYTAGIMFIFRQFLAGPVIHALTPLGVLCLASILTACGLFALGNAKTAAAAFVAATIFGIGKTYLWPTMLGVVAERFPKGGALALGIVGAAGMLSVGWLMTPAMGKIQDHYAVQALTPAVQELVVVDGGLNEAKVRSVTEPAAILEIENAKKHSATMTYKLIAVIPLVLSLIFLTIFLYYRRSGGYRAIDLSERKTTPTADHAPAL